MSMLKIEKYSKKENVDNKPDLEWNQVDTNPTSIASLLMVIASLEIGQSIKITKL